MPTVKEESFSFGGVDSRSNPTNFPKDRALRCINFAPQESGALRIRPGYTVPFSSTVTNEPIHSAIYYEQFSASYLGPQFVLYGQSSGIYLVPIGSPTATQIGAFTTQNPWGHFRSGNRIFLSDGVTDYNWDGTTLRTTGLPAFATLPVLPPPTEYAGTGISLTFPPGLGPWTNPGNATGAPDGSYATATAATTSDTTEPLQLTGYGFSIPTTQPILAMAVSVTGHVTQTLAVHNPAALVVQPVYAGANTPAPSEMIEFPTNDGDLTITTGGVNDSVLASGLTPTIVNDPSFGVTLLGRKSAVNGSPANWSIDACQITIWYLAENGVVVSVTSSSLGSIAPTQLSGYQLYAAIYDPITQHMGNCAPIGGLNTVGATLSAFVVSNLPDLANYNTEWEWALGMTNDGGQVPYWFVDALGNNIVLSNSATNGTVYLGNVNALQELPFRNDPPRPFDKYAAVGTRIFAGLAGNPFMSYSNDPSDVSNANYVGQPVESWPPDQQEPLPDGLLPMAMHAYRLEGWFFSRENLHIWSQFLLQQGVNPWRGPWPGGCAGQRAFVETPHGPFWVTPQKQLVTFMEDGVISVSEEYELALLGLIATQNLGETEVAYLLDPDSLIDQIVIRGFDANDNPVIVIHDFNLEEERSPHGQGYQYQYNGLNVQTFVGAGYTPRQNVYDQNAKMRLWAGSSAGFFAQLEDGVSDNTATYNGDYLALIPLGTQRRSLAELEYQGDPNMQFSYLTDYSLGIGDFTPINQDPIPDIPVQTGTRFGAKMGGEEARMVYLRVQFTSNGSGSFAVSNPPFLPLPSYGSINQSILKLGAPRPEGR